MTKRAKAKTRAYLRAVAWVALNDDAANVTDMDAVREGLTTALVADVFGHSTDDVATDVMRVREHAAEADKAAEERGRDRAMGCECRIGGRSSCPVHGEPT